MNISNETSRKILELLSDSEANDLKQKMSSIDTSKLLEMFKQINPTEKDMKNAEEKLNQMSSSEIISEVMKNLKG